MRERLLRFIARMLRINWTVVIIPPGHQEATENKEE
jgi:hypothetical protein